MKAELCCARTVCVQHLQSYFAYIHLRPSTAFILLLLSKKTRTPSYPKIFKPESFLCALFCPAESKQMENIWRLHQIGRIMAYYLSDEFSRESLWKGSKKGPGWDLSAVCSRSQAASLEKEDQPTCVGFPSSITQEEDISQVFTKHTWLLTSHLWKKIHLTLTHPCY